MVSSLDQLLHIQRVINFLYINLTLELLTFKLSYLRNWAVWFIETCRVNVK